MSKKYKNQSTNNIIRGFTLIELLAVIVILAIIALIAIPIVINIINDSKNSSDEQTVELYIDAVQKAITKKQLSNSNFNPKECMIQNSGNLLCDAVEINIDMKGILPNDGVITLSKNKIYYKGLKLNEKYYNNVVKLISDADSNGSISIGDKYTYKVNDKDTFNFYVLSIEDNQVNLIMDRNICEDGTLATANNTCLIAWYNDGDIDTSNDTNEFGPVTAMQGVYNATKNWDNVPNMNLNYDDITDQRNAGYTNSTSKGYKGVIIINGIGKIINKNETSEEPLGTIKIPLKARLPKFSEIYARDEEHCAYENGTCPVWLVEYLRKTGQSLTAQNKYASNEEIEGIIGYWLISSSDIRYGRIVEFDGMTMSVHTSSIDWAGIRPVITVPINYLSN